MDIATASFIALGIILVAVISYFAGRKNADTDIQLLHAELEWQRLARKEQTRKYDELYDAFLRVNKYNANLKKEMQKYKNTYEECGDEVYQLFLSWKTRKEICKLYPSVAYSTICRWIRQRKEEILSDPTNAKPAKLF